MIEVKTLPILSIMSVCEDKSFPYFTKEIYMEVNKTDEDVEKSNHPIRPWITVKTKIAMIDGKRKANDIETWNNRSIDKPIIKPYTQEELLGLFWNVLAKPYLVQDSYELMKLGLIKQMQKRQASKETINRRIIGMLDTKSRKQCTYTKGTSYCNHCGDCKTTNKATLGKPKKDKTGITMFYHNIHGYESFHTDESILFYHDSMYPYKGHDINKIRYNYSIRNPLSKSDNDITVIERIYLDDGEYHDYILHKGHDYSRIKAFDKEPEFIIHNGERLCPICGARLRHRGKYCKKHTRGKINAFNRKISYITNIKHSEDSYNQSTKLFTSYGDLDGKDYRKIYNTKFWTNINYIELKASSNRGKVEVNRIAGTRKEYVNKTFDPKSKTKYVNLLQNMRFGYPRNLNRIYYYPQLCLLNNSFKFERKLGAENKYQGIKPKRFCPHINRNDKGFYRCDCLKHELVESDDCNTWDEKKVYGYRNHNTDGLRTYPKPEYSPSAYDYTGYNLPMIPTLNNDTWLPKLMKEKQTVKTIMGGEYPLCKYHNQPVHLESLTNKFPYPRYVITYNKLGHMVYYHLKAKENRTTNQILISKAKKIMRQLLYGRR